MRLIHTFELKSVNLLICLKPNQSVNQSADQAIRKARRQVTAIKMKHKVKTCSENSTAPQNLEHPAQKETELTFQGVYFHQVLFRIQLSHFKLFCKHSSHIINFIKLMIIISNGFTIASAHSHLEHGCVSFCFFFIYIIINNNVKQKP